MGAGTGESLRRQPIETAVAAKLGGSNGRNGTVRTVPSRGGAPRAAGPLWLGIDVLLASSLIGGCGCRKVKIWQLM